MIISDKEAEKRLNSPLNLINKLKSTRRDSAMSLFGIGKNNGENKKEFISPFKNKKEEEIAIQPKATLDNILENSESQIKLGLAHDKALDLLTRSVDTLSSKLDEVKADKLPAVVGAASKVVESIRRERNEANKNNKDGDVHYHFYTPKQNEISDYGDIIDVIPTPV